MAILFSNEFNVSQEQMFQTGVFDVFLDEDSHFFINIKRLQVCTVPECLNAYEKVNQYFHNIGLLLAKAKVGDKLYQTAIDYFDFSEVSGINLGFSEGTRGSGFGKKLSNKIVKDAYDIIQAGTNEPEIFQLVSLFEENVGPDRISDMVAKIISDEIVSYSKRIYTELNINSKTFPSFQFDDGILQNPYKKSQLLLLPAEILHKLPVAKEWSEVDRVCRENRAIKRELNSNISKEWAKMSSSAKKDYLLQYIFKNPEKVGRLIQSYKDSKVGKCNFFEDIDYLIKFIKSSIDFEKENLRTSFEASKEILNSYKRWVEYHRGALVINPRKQKASEKVVQRTIHAVALMYCELNNWDISPETDNGRGPVDFKISRGNDKTVIEIKLSSNAQCVHGLETQIEEYAKAENTANKIFVVVKVTPGSQRIQFVKRKWKEMKNKGLEPAEIIEIDAVEKKAASTYRSQE